MSMALPASPLPAGALLGNLHEDNAADKSHDSGFHGPHRTRHIVTLPTVEILGARDPFAMGFRILEPDKEVWRAHGGGESILL